MPLKKESEKDTSERVIMRESGCKEEVRRIY